MEQTELKLTCQKLTPQAQRLLDRLRIAPLTNAQMRDELRLLEYRRRMTEIRRYLKPRGQTTKKKPLGGGVIEYRLVNIN